MVLRYPHIRRLVVFLAAAALVLALTIRTDAARRWTGGVMIMEHDPSAAARARDSAAQERHINDLALMAQSETVMQRSAETMWRLSVNDAPETLLATLDVELIPDSNMLWVKVTAEDKDEAKAAADVVAAEFAKFYQEMQHNQPSGGDTTTGTSKAAEGPSIKVVDRTVWIVPFSWPRRILNILWSPLGIIMAAFFGLGLLVGLFAGNRFARRRASRA